MNCHYLLLACLLCSLAFLHYCDNMCTHTARMLLLISFPLFSLYIGKRLKNIKGPLLKKNPSYALAFSGSFTVEIRFDHFYLFILIINNSLQFNQKDILKLSKNVLMTSEWRQKHHTLTSERNWGFIVSFFVFFIGPGVSGWVDPSLFLFDYEPNLLRAVAFYTSFKLPDHLIQNIKLHSRKVFLEM